MPRERRVWCVASSRKTPINKLDSAIHGILEDYSAEISQSMDQTVKRVTREGVKALRAESRRAFPNGTAAYAKGWTSSVDTKKRSAQGVIYNKDLPGLPHLLEYGHANRGGGRTPGRVHIEPVENTIAQSFVKEVTKAI